MYDLRRAAGSRRAWRMAVAAAVIAASLTACDQDGSGTLPSPTRSVTRTELPSLTGSLPSRTRTTASDETPDSTTTQEETSEPTSEETTSEPTTEPTSETTAPSRTTVTRETEVTVTSSPTPTDDATGAKKEKDKSSKAEADDGVPDWVWWLLAALLAAGALLALLLPRAMRRRRWDTALASAADEARWLAAELLPQLQQAVSVAEVAGGWQVSAARVATLEDRLTGLASSAPDEQRDAHATQLRDAVRVARTDVEALIADGRAPSPARELSGIASRLNAAVEATPTR